MRPERRQGFRIGRRMRACGGAYPRSRFQAQPDLERSRFRVRQFYVRPGFGPGCCRSAGGGAGMPCSVRSDPVRTAEGPGNPPRPYGALITPGVRGPGSGVRGPGSGVRRLWRTATEIVCGRRDAARGPDGAVRRSRRDGGRRYAGLAGGLCAALADWNGICPGTLRYERFR